MDRANDLTVQRRVYVDSSPVGTGKTYRAIERAVRQPAKWLFSVERIASVVELEQRIRAQTATLGSLVICAIASSAERRGHSVKLELEALPPKFESGHVIAICTHAALMMSDLSAFAGWQLVIDEIPEVLQSAEIATKLDVAFFERHYSLTKLNDHWSVVQLTGAGSRISGSDLFQDDSHRHLRTFHQRVLSSSEAGGRAVACNLREWRQMSGQNVKWTWWSLFTLEELRVFQSVTLIGNGFTESVAAKIFRQWSPDVVWADASAKANRAAASRRVCIRYFSCERRASKSLFQSPKGQAQLPKIAEFIRQDAPHGKIIWSCNEVSRTALESHLPASAWIRPKQAGTNAYVEFTHAAMIYAAKPSPDLMNVIEAVGVTAEDWVQSNEFEAILQFATRTSVRDPSSTSEVTLYVFDQHQADYLARFMASQSHLRPEVEWIDLELDLAPAKPGPKPKTVSPEEAERQAEHRRQQKRDSARRSRERVRCLRTTPVAGREPWTPIPLI